MRVVFLFLSAFFTLGLVQADAQCSKCQSTCSVDYSCPADLGYGRGGVCDTILDTAMAGNYYADTLTFYVPYQFTDPGTGYDVEINSYEMKSAQNLPAGLCWQTNYAPSNLLLPPQGDTLGCLQVCGTPVSPGSYEVKFFFQMDITAKNTPVGDVNRTVDTNYTVHLEVLPDTSGGVSSFSYDPLFTSTCGDSLALNFEALVDGDPNPTMWQWTFSNGNTSSAKEPSQQVFDSTGDHHAQLTTTIFQYTITEFVINDVPGNYAQGPCGELTTVGDPDLYIKIPELGFVSSVVDNTTSATWTFSPGDLNVPMGKTQFKVEIWDEDPTWCNGTDDSLAADQIYINNYSMGTPGLWSSGGASGTITFDTIPNTVIEDTLALNVYNNPAPPALTQSADSLCKGDSLQLSYPANNYLFSKWYRDSTAIPGANDTALQVTQSGAYKVRVTDSNGCTTFSDDTSVTFLQTPPKDPAFYYANGELIATNAGNFDIQWYLDGSPVPGANSTTFEPPQEGSYTLALSNEQCQTKSDSFYVEFTNITSVKRDISLEVYPNPNKGRFTVAINGSQWKQMVISLQDVTGRQIYREQGKKTGDKWSRTFNFTDEPAGVYFLTIRGDGRHLKRKVIFR